MKYILNFEIFYEICKILFQNFIEFYRKKFKKQNLESDANYPGLTHEEVTTRRDPPEKNKIQNNNKIYITEII